MIENCPRNKPILINGNLKILLFPLLEHIKLILELTWSVYARKWLIYFLLHFVEVFPLLVSRLIESYYLFARLSVCIFLINYFLLFRYVVYGNLLDLIIIQVKITLHHILLYLRFLSLNLRLLISFHQYLLYVFNLKLLVIFLQFFLFELLAAIIFIQPIHKLLYTLNFIVIYVVKCLLLNIASFGIQCLLINSWIRK